MKFHLSGKWALAGEHAVVRGGSAFLLPHAEYRMTFDWSPDQITERVPETLGVSIQRLMNRLSQHLGRKLSLPGRLEVTSTIPEGAGFGSSAALCVGFCRLLESQLRDQDLFQLARYLEGEFHGTSSGMDVATVLAEQPILFFGPKNIERIVLRQLPRFSFHDTGLRASTRKAVEQVQAFITKNPEKGDLMDQQMDKAVQKTKKGMVEYSETSGESGIQDIIQGMQLAHQCFEGWGLVPDSIQEQIDDLRTQGALAVKLTGSGNGGFLVALWQD